MKKILLYFSIFIIAIAIESCQKDVLNVKNLHAYNPEDTWNDETLADAYLADIYASLPGWPVNQGNWADESVGILANGDVQTTNSAFKYWPYSTIRKINILLNDIDNGNLSDNVKNVMKGQAYFLRAFHYFKAVVYHGGVPIIKVPQLLTDDLMVSRNSTKECFDFIIDDLDKAISMLPDRFTGDDYGRIDKAAAMAFKGRVLLYKASPQFNPDNPYNNSYWQDAYSANKDAKEFLEGLGYGLYEDYNGIWMNEGNKEDVMVVIYKNPGKTNGRREDCVRPLSQSKNCTGGDQPIWNLVESYPMKDGYQPGSSPNYSYDIQSFWENRDPRFYATIVYNGCILPLGVSPDRRQYTDLQLGGTVDGFGDLETFYRSGFNCKKGIDNSLSQAEVNLNAVDWVEIRFAEVLLNFAEAANETGHPDEALAVLKQIRQRAGIEPGADGMYGLKSGMSRDEMRNAIYFERYIEFTFEGKRFWDLRRTRRLVPDINGMHKYGLEAHLKTGLDPNDKTVTYLPGDFDYTVRELITTGPKAMYTPDTYYFFPISKDEIEKDPNLEQTIGWEGGTFDPTIH